jgi:hypothetical protein
MVYLPEGHLMQEEIGFHDRSGIEHSYYIVDG